MNNPLINPGVGTILWMIISFGILALILCFWGWPALLKSLHSREEAITASLNEAMMCQKQHAMGWHLLLNEHAVVRRGQDSMVVAGMENESRKEEQTRGDIRKTMEGVRPGAFTVMLQHDPTAWERTILPQSEAQLTLSGHTHGGQFRFFGWSPAALSYKEWGGFYQENKRAINVSTGLGGFVPFRFGVTPEIVVITLRSD